MRDAIDKCEMAGERGAFQIKADSGGYPPDLETIVKGVEAQGGKKSRFLRSIPADPITKSKERGIRSMQDDPDSDSWADKMCSTFTPSRVVRDWRARSTRTGGH